MGSRKTTSRHTSGSALASEAGDESAKSGLQIAESEMTASQIAEAKELADDWRESHR